MANSSVPRRAGAARKARSRSRAKSGQPHDEVSSLRETGIDAIGHLPWGAHICLFYETKRDLLDTNVAYFRAGLESDEFCVWAVSDPISEEDARNALRRGVPNFDRYLARGQVEILLGYDWYLKGDEFELQRITGGWHAKLAQALAEGYDGMRVSGNAFWMTTNHWKEFREYEQELDKSLGGYNMIVLCTYSLRAARAVDVLDVTRAHQFTIARRKGKWEFVEMPELRQAKRVMRRPDGALSILSEPFPGHELLTPRERAALSQIVRGASSKEIARMLGISPRTVDFHRANIMQKLGAKSTIGVVRIVLGEARRAQSSSRS
jgi:DNA-binding CsgD family transcriptional regulator